MYICMYIYEMKIHLFLENVVRRFKRANVRRRRGACVEFKLAPDGHGRCGEPARATAEARTPTDRGEVWLPRAKDLSSLGRTDEDLFAIRLKKRHPKSGLVLRAVSDKALLCTFSQAFRHL